MSRRIYIFILITFILLFGLGCEQESDINGPDINSKQDNKAEEEKEDIKKEQQMSIHLPIEETLNPLIVEKQLSAHVLGLVYDSLIEYDNSLSVEPSLAESWEVSQDGLEWTIKLRDNVKWHDGENFKAEDVEATINLISILGDKCPYSYAVKNISSYSNEGDNTLKISLNQPQYNLIKFLDFPILPFHQLTTQEADSINGEQFSPIGTGAYKVEITNGIKDFILRVNNSWWTEDKPIIKEINVKMIPNDKTVLDSLKVKEIDFAYTNYIDWNKYASKGEYKISEYVTNYYDFLAFNFNNEILSDINIRKAIAYSIDRDQIIDKVLLGHGVKTDTPIAPGTYLFDPSNKYVKDIEMAKNLIVQAGYKDNDGDGIVEKDGQPLIIKLVTNNENEIRKQTAGMIAEQLKDIGIDVRIESLIWEDIKEAINSSNFDMILSGYNLPPFMDVSFAFHTEEVERGTNFINYSNPDLDQLFYQVYYAKDKEEEIDIYKQIQDVLKNDLPYFSLYYRTSAILYNNDLKGDMKPIATDIFNNIETWYVD